jgi:nucleotidyltransferase substrate binding protein (TIGR01987 family)
MEKEDMVSILSIGNLARGVGYAPLCLVREALWPNLTCKFLGAGVNEKRTTIMILDISSLRSAYTALNKSLGFLYSDLASNPDLREQFRAASIQGFEFTHELAFKMLKRQLEQMVADPAEVDKMTYMEIIRSGAEAGLITDVGRFKDYRDKRNITSHTYNQAKAEFIVAVLQDFAEDILYLLEELERRNSASD